LYRKTDLIIPFRDIMVVEKYADNANPDIQSGLIITVKGQVRLRERLYLLNYRLNSLQGENFILFKFVDRSFILNKISNLLSKYQEVITPVDNIPDISSSFRIFFCCCCHY